MTKSAENAIREAQGHIPAAYDMRLCDVRELMEESQRDPWEAIAKAFRYGFTQGKRAAQKQAREA